MVPREVKVRHGGQIVYSPPLKHKLVTLHSSMSSSQRSPRKPVPEHAQLKLPKVFAQMPPFAQGFASVHSSMSSVHWGPANPVPRQSQVKEVARTKQLARLEQTSVWQVLFCQPQRSVTSGQEHKPLQEQRPLLKQGWLKQSLAIVSHFIPALFTLERYSFIAVLSRSVKYCSCIVKTL